MTPLKPIPQVPKQLLNLFGSLPDVDFVAFAESLWRLADLYGPIYQLDFSSEKVIAISSYELIKEVLDDEHYQKAIIGSIAELKPLFDDGLFSSHNHEENWGMAHRILMPIFGPLAVRNMFEDQLDIASQMVLKWDRLGPENEISVYDNFSRLAIDTIAYCAFTMRLNRFYNDDHRATQIFDKVNGLIDEASRRAARTRLETPSENYSEIKFRESIKQLHDLCYEMIAERRKDPHSDKKDILDAMLENADPETGKKLPDQNIVYQILTFMAAGETTTSMTLANLFFNFMQQPDTYHKAQKEVDQVIGSNALRPEHLPKLRYIDACVKETLRLNGPVPQIERQAKTTQTLGGKYTIEPSDSIIVNLRNMHRDPAIWGDDSAEFRPERMLDMKKYPPGSWKPFGTGMRSCIGRPFAEQEMFMSIALILQRFQIDLGDSTYRQALKDASFLNPTTLKMKVRRRPGRGMDVGLTLTNNQSASKSQKTAQVETHKNGKGLTILYGSNAGTCKSYAQEIAASASRFGYCPEVHTLDSAIENASADHPFIMIAPSYEGKPPDNAKSFVAWLEENSSSTDMLKNVQYAICGVGNSEWSSSFHKVPQLINKLLQQMGARPFAEIGLVDVKYDMVGPWEDWCEQIWTKLGSEQASNELSLEATIQRSVSSDILAGFATSTAIVRDNSALTDTSVGPRKMHMELELPKNVEYRSGDYLAITPYNHPDTLDRVLNRFGLNPSDTISISKTTKEFLKTSHPTTIYEFLGTRVELNMPITHRQLEKLVSSTDDEAEIESLKHMMEKSSEIVAKRFSIIDVLEEHPTCNLDFITYLDLLKPLSPRQYSISSSPFSAMNLGQSQFTASITYDVLEEPAMSGKNRQFHGVASSYLASVNPGAKISCTVRPTNAGFHLPTDTQTPIILVATGTGIAPMRGFLQERAAIAKAGGRTLGPALFYFGCRDYEKDYIYKDELEEWEKLGVVSMRTCFSRSGPHGCYRYTADRIYAEKEEIGDLYIKGAKIFVCGSASKVARSTADMFIKIWMEGNPGKPESDAQEWLDSIKEDRYVSDVFG